MNGHELSGVAAEAAHEILVWVGFGTLAGLAAKAIMPGRDPGGAIATLTIGIAGSVIGCGVMVYFFPDHRVTPISFVGFLLATGGAFVLLLAHRILVGGVVDEAGSRGPVGWWRFPWHGRRRYASRA